LSTSDFIRDVAVPLPPSESNNCNRVCSLFFFKLSSVFWPRLRIKLGKFNFFDTPRLGLPLRKGNGLRLLQLFPSPGVFFCYLIHLGPRDRKVAQENLRSYGGLLFHPPRRPWKATIKKKGSQLRADQPPLAIVRLVPSYPLTSLSSYQRIGAKSFCNLLGTRMTDIHE